MTFEIWQILKMTLPQKNGHRIQTPSSKLTMLVSSCWEKKFIRNNAHNFFILSLVFLKLLIVSVAFFLGHPVYHAPSWILWFCNDCIYTSMSILPIQFEVHFLNQEASHMLHFQWWNNWIYDSMMHMTFLPIFLTLKFK